MERSSITKWLFLGLAIFLFWQYGRKAIFGPGAVEHQSFVNDYTAAPAAERPAEDLCQIDGGGFTAKLSTQGASAPQLRPHRSRLLPQRQGLAADRAGPHPRSGPAPAAHQPARARRHRPAGPLRRPRLEARRARRQELHLHVHQRHDLADEDHRRDGQALRARGRSQGPEPRGRAEEAPPRDRADVVRVQEGHRGLPRSPVAAAHRDDGRHGGRQLGEERAPVAERLHAGGAGEERVHPREVAPEPRGSALRRRQLQLLHAHRRPDRGPGQARRRDADRGHLRPPLRRRQGEGSELRAHLPRPPRLPRGRA